MIDPNTMVLVDRVLDDDSAVVRTRGSFSIAEGAWEVTDRYEIAVGPVVHLPRVINEPIALLQRAWPSIVGPDMSRFAQPFAIQGRVLVIKCLDVHWSHQLSFLERVVIECVNRLHLAAPVERLRFRHGRLAA